MPAGFPVIEFLDKSLCQWCYPKRLCLLWLLLVFCTGHRYSCICSTQLWSCCCFAWWSWVLKCWVFWQHSLSHRKPSTSGNTEYILQFDNLHPYFRHLPKIFRIILLFVPWFKSDWVLKLLLLFLKGVGVFALVLYQSTSSLHWDWDALSKLLWSQM